MAVCTFCGKPADEEIGGGKRFAKSVLEKL
jgi:hypothetical protein